VAGAHARRPRRQGDDAFDAAARDGIDEGPGWVETFLRPRRVWVVAQVRRAMITISG
jgi:hypothetical protein